MDCFSTIMNSYFILDINEIKSTISILSSLLMYTEMNNESNKDENNNVTFKYEWLNEHYEHFFTKMLPFIQFSLKLAKFDSETNEQIIESILVLLNYMIHTLSLITLIKSDFISDSVKFIVLNTKKVPFTSLQITKTILSKIENNCQLALLSQNEQFELFDNLCKCLIALLNHNNHKTPSQLKEENLNGKLTIFFLRIFETIHLLGLKIDLFFSFNSDIRIHESACQLLNKTGAIIHSQIAFKFFENSDCLLTYVLILKVCLSF